MKMLTLLGIFIFSISAVAMNGRTTYQAKIVKPDGYPLEASSVNYKFSILDATGSCVLYTETYSAINMTATGGLISFALGGGTRGFPPASATTAVFSNVFDNSITSMPCEAAGIYNPTPADVRKIVMQFNDGNGWQTLPAMPINAVPYAMYAAKSVDSKTLNGKADTAFLQKATDIPTCAAGKMLYFNMASFSCIDVPATGVSINSVSVSGSALSITGTASDPVITMSAASMSQDGYLTSLDYAEFKAKLSASSTQIINTLGYTPVSSSTVATQIASSTLAGDVSGNPGTNTVDSVGGKTASQISTSVDDTLAASSGNVSNALVKRNSSGNVTVNDIYANAAKINYVDIYKPSTSFNIRLQAPTSLSTNYVLNLPTTSGTTGQVLSTDGSGNLSWISPTTGSVVSVSATAPLASTGGSTPTISITQSTSSTDGYLSSTDWNTFNNKQNATSAAIIATLGYTPADNAASGTYAQKANNLSDLTNTAQARSNLGLGGFATTSSLDLGSASATGILAIARLPSFSGDVTSVSSSNVITLNTVGAGVTSGAQYTKVTVDGKGRVVSGADLSSSDVTTALGYTPATSTTLAASFVQKTGDTMTGVLNLPSKGLVVGTSQLVVSGTYVGIGVVNPTAALNLKAGTTTNAPLKLTSGTLLSSAQSGTIEYDGSQLYFTDGANTRRALATNSAAGSFDNTSSISNTSGNITLSPNNVTGSVIVNSSAASISSGTGALVVNGGVGIAGGINAGGNLNLTGSATIGQSLSLSSMTSGSLLFAGASGLVSENNSKLFWDGANQRLGLGTNAPAQTLSVSGASYFSGNVGIGTSNPITKLHIEGDGTQVRNSSTTNASHAYTLRNNVTNKGWSLYNLSSTDITPNGFLLEQFDGSSFLRRLTVDQSGNVGIGTASPLSVLQVNSTNIENANFARITGDTRIRIGRPGAAATDNGIIGWNDTLKQLQFYISGAGAGSVLNVANNGNVGIGTTTPSAPFTVQGHQTNQNSQNNVFSSFLNFNKDRAGSTVQDGDELGQVLASGYNGSDFQYAGLIKFRVQGMVSGTSMPGSIEFATTPVGSNSPLARMYINNLGNVGIGTTAPVTRLDIRGPNGSPSSYASGTLAINTGGVAALLFGTDDTIASAEYAWIQSHGTRPLHINKVGNNTVLNANAGNVGVGTSAPGSKLDVNGSLIVRGANIKNSLGNTASSAKWVKLGKWTAFQQGRNLLIRIESGVGYNANPDQIGSAEIRVRTSNASSINANGFCAATALRAIGVGRFVNSVKIVSNSPGCTASEYNVYVNLQPFSGEGAFFSVETDVSSSWQNDTIVDVADPGVASASVDVVSFASNTVNGNAHFVGGNVGIGTTTPGYKLDVSGTINIASGSALAFGGTSVCTAAGCTSSSDERLKENIKPLDFDLNKLLSLKAVQYDWKNKAKYGDKHQIGFIAQNLEQVYPEVVYTDKNTGLKSVTYGHLVAPVIEALKSLYKRIVGVEDGLGEQRRQIASIVESKADKAEIEDLRKDNVVLKQKAAKVDELEAENAAKAKEIDALKSYLCSKDPAAPICK